MFIEDDLSFDDIDNPPPVSSSVEGKSKGRPEVINDEDLRRYRDTLVVLLENTWGDVGWNLRNSVKSHSDVRAAFQVWEKEPILPYAASALLRHSDQPSDHKQLWALEHQKDVVLQSLLETEQSRQRSVELLEKANRALVFVPEDQHKLVAEHVAERKTNLERAESILQSLRNRLSELDELIKDSHAYLAQAEVLQFCTKGRYAFNPLNAANSIAGLPSIGYRRSIDRCRGWAREDGVPYRIFLMIQRICAEWPREITLVEYAEKWLRTRCPSGSRKSKPRKQKALQQAADAFQVSSVQIEFYALDQMQKKWYYLRRSITTALNSKDLVPEQLPYKIAAEFFQRMAQPTSVDSMFEEDEQICPSITDILVRDK